MMSELEAVAAEDFATLHNDSDFPFRLIPRRLNNFMNSSGRSIKKLSRGKGYNPAFMNPQDMLRLGIAVDSEVKIATRYDSIYAIVEPDTKLRPGVIAMSHAFGGLADEDHRFRELGSNTSRLVRTDVDYDEITGMPRQGNIPVRVEA
jgi:anaerobic selenocysteine-containing dehydrogenase